MGGHRSAEDIAGELKRSGARLARGSVYNSVAALRSAGLVMAADTGPGRTLYEASDMWHHHFVCRVCGSVTDVECVTGEKPCLEAEIPSARTEEAQVIFRGVCPSCTEDSRGVATRRPTPGARR